jgi:hypothetical protein
VEQADQAAAEMVLRLLTPQALQERLIQVAAVAVQVEITVALQQQAVLAVLELLF